MRPLNGHEYLRWDETRTVKGRMGRTKEVKFVRFGCSCGAHNPDGIQWGTIIARGSINAWFVQHCLEVLGAVMSVRNIDDDEARALWPTLSLGPTQ